MSSMWELGEKRMLVAGHRGVKALRPENTIESFQYAIDLGVDGIETDIWMTRDGELVLMHDNNIERTTNGTGDIRDYTLKELKQFDAGSKFSPEYAGLEIPTLDEFLSLVKGKNLMLNLEIKDYREEVVDKTMKKLMAGNFDDTFLINSFSGEITTYAYKKYDVKTHGFYKTYYENFKPEYYDCLYSVGITLKDLTPEVCKEYKDMGIEPWCWSPDTEEEVEFAIKCGAVLATINDPRAALRLSR